MFYETGRAVEPSWIEAAKLYRSAADRGWASAQCNLGRLYETGRGVPPSNEDAIAWYQRAAQGGDRLAREALLRLQTQAEPSAEEESASERAREGGDA
jgi:TPR repeat protein